VKWAVAIVVVAAIVALLIDSFVLHHLLLYDEADYTVAANQGLLANYTDANALSFADFIASGTGAGGDRSKRTELSELVRERGDIPFLRHYHGPLSTYWLIVGRALGATGEPSMRAWFLVLLGVLALVSFAIATIVHQLDAPVAMLPAVLLLGSSISIGAMSLISPHALYAITSLLSLALLSHAMSTGNERNWYLAVGALALAFLSVEYALLLAATFGVCAWLARRHLVRPGGMIRFILRSLGLLLLVIGVLWVGGIVKLTLVKNYLFFAYFSLVRSAAYGSNSLLDVWSHHFSNAPVACAVALAALVYGLVRIRRDRHLLPYVLYPLLVLSTSLRNSSMAPSYVSSIFPPLFMLAAVHAGGLLRGRSRAPGWALAGIVAVASAVTLSAPSQNTDECNESLLRSVVATIDAMPARDSSLLVPREHLPVLQYYLGHERHFTGFSHELDDSATVRHFARERMITSAIVYSSTDVGRFDAIFPASTLLSTVRMNPPCGLSFSQYQLHSP
jgi:hypothetical protein